MSGVTVMVSHMLPPAPNLPPMIMYDAAAAGLQGAYDPEEYANLPVTDDVQASTAVGLAQFSNCMGIASCACHACAAATCRWCTQLPCNTTVTMHGLQETVSLVCLYLTGNLQVHRAVQAGAPGAPSYEADALHTRVHPCSGWHR